MSASAGAGVASVARGSVGVAGGGGRPVGRVACVAVINHNVRLQSGCAGSSLHPLPLASLLGAHRVGNATALWLLGGAAPTGRWDFVPVDCCGGRRPHGCQLDGIC